MRAARPSLSRAFREDARKPKLATISGAEPGVVVAYGEAEQIVENWIGGGGVEVFPAADLAGDPE